MKSLFITVILFFSVIYVSGQCKCDTISRSNGTFGINCQVIPIAGDSLTQIGLNVSKEGNDVYIGTIVRFLKGSGSNAGKLDGEMTLLLENEHIVSLKLNNSQNSVINNSHVAQAIYKTDEKQCFELKEAYIKLITLRFSDGMTKIYNPGKNRNAIFKQLRCIR